MIEEIWREPCPDCGADNDQLYRMVDLPSGALWVFCECGRCGRQSAGAILTAGAIARSPGGEIVEITAAENWNQMVARLRERGEI